eukprot:Clim_evm30s166 gene=Clim_evmTU30s166
MSGAGAAALLGGAQKVEAPKSQDAPVVNEIKDDKNKNQEIVKAHMTKLANEYKKLAESPKVGNISNKSDEEMKKVMDWLRKNMKTRSGIGDFGQEGLDRVAYFRGEHAIRALTSKKCPFAGKDKMITGRSAAIFMMQWIMDSGNCRRAEYKVDTFLRKKAQKLGENVEIHPLRSVNPRMVKRTEDGGAEMFVVPFSKGMPFDPANEALFVWNYDLPNYLNYFIGILILTVIVAFVLTPLWPPTIRHYLSYLTGGSLYLLIGIIYLCVFRLSLFIALWILTLGKIHFWILPDLFADKDFLDSFVPVYSLWIRPRKVKAKEE